MEIDHYLEVTKIDGWKDMASQMAELVPKGMLESNPQFSTFGWSYDEIKGKIPLFNKFIQERTKKKLENFKFYCLPAQRRIRIHRDGSTIYYIPFYRYAFNWPITHNPQSVLEYWSNVPGNVELPDNSKTTELFNKGETESPFYYANTSYTSKHTASMYLETAVDESRCKLIDKIHVTQPIIVRTDKWHGVNNCTDTTRIIASIRWGKFNDVDINNYIDLDGLL